MEVVTLYNDVYAVKFPYAVVTEMTLAKAIPLKVRQGFVKSRLEIKFAGETLETAGTKRANSDEIHKAFPVETALLKQQVADLAEWVIFKVVDRNDSKLRPYPPASLLDGIEEKMLPAPEVEQWLRKTFLDDKSNLYNKEHDHLKEASIGVLWTNAPNSRQMRDIAGTAQLAKPPQSAGTWAKVAWAQQMREWFGIIPDFLVTLYAPYAADSDDAGFCALVEHEVYHCAQAIDQFGCPKFSKTTGRPVFAMRGHDVEEFVGIVRRYGAGAAAGSTAALIDASKRAPEISLANIAAACGTCALKSA